MDRLMYARLKRGVLPLSGNTQLKSSGSTPYLIAPRSSQEYKGLWNDARAELPSGKSFSVTAGPIERRFEM